MIMGTSATCITCNCYFWHVRPCSRTPSIVRLFLSGSGILWPSSKTIGKIMSVCGNFIYGQCMISSAVCMRIYSVSVGNGVIVRIHGMRVSQIDTLCTACFLNSSEIRVACIHTDGNPAASLSLPRSTKY